MKTVVRAHVLVKGRVQGVAYRAFARDCAVREGVSGWVRNLADGRVELQVEGLQERIDVFLGALGQGPLLARVDNVHVEWLEATGEFQSFQIT